MAKFGEGSWRNGTAASDGSYVPNMALSDTTGAAIGTSGSPLVSSDTASAPASTFTAVVTSDSTALVAVRALYVGTSGDVIVRSVGSSTSVTFKAVPAGAILPIKAEKIMAATTAADIVALY